LQRRDNDKVGAAMKHRNPGAVAMKSANVQVALRRLCATVGFCLVGPTTIAQTDTSASYPAVEYRPAGHFECATPDEFPASVASFNDRAWPDGFVPFEFDADLTAQERQHMRTAMDWWTLTTGVKFVYRVNEPAFMFVTRSPDANISWSRAIGRRGDGQNVEIADSHWSDHGIIAHELCHALGWLHEQARPDQEAFVTIEWDNIPENRWGQFEINEGSLTLGLPYDYGSIMHYRACSFSVCDTCAADDGDCRTITTVDEEWQDRIGQRDHLSEGDILDVSTVYGPRMARYVRVGGDGDGRLSDPLGSITAASSAIPAGGFILLEGGTYQEAATYDQPSEWRAHGAAAEIR
jgi:hypothetical protein